MSDIWLGFIGRLHTIKLLSFYIYAHFTRLMLLIADHNAPIVTLETTQSTAKSWNDGYSFNEGEYYSWTPSFDGIMYNVLSPMCVNNSILQSAMYIYPPWLWQTVSFLCRDVSECQIILHLNKRYKFEHRLCFATFFLPKFNRDFGHTHTRPSATSYIPPCCTKEHWNNWLSHTIITELFQYIMTMIVIFKFTYSFRSVLYACQ